VGQEFEGDLMMVDTPDGGDLILEDGVFKADPAFSTAVYLSLFGGNKEESGKIKTNKTWWGNTLENTSDAEKIISRFQYIITAMPLCVKNIKAAESAAQMDLQWILDMGIADKILTECQTGERNLFILKIVILKDKNTIFENSYYSSWAVKSGGSNGSV